ncbi:TonB-dependent receptor [bacterium]|nr:TonB-dependent receptor [bacterium]
MTSFGRYRGLSPGILLGVVFFLTAPRPLASQGVLGGRVIDAATGRAVSSVNIIVSGTLFGTASREDGGYRTGRLPAGTYTVIASRIGYATETVEGVVIRDDAVTTVNFSLRETVVELDPVVVIGGKTEQTLNRSPVSISLVTARDIERQNAMTLVQSLEQLAGVHFVGDQLNIRGSTGYTFGAGNKVLLLLDGVPVYAADTGGFNWDMIPVLDVKRIEVLKGAGSTLWGASALGGVVNVITKTPESSARLGLSLNSGKYDRPWYREWEWTDASRLFYVRPDISYAKRFGRFSMRVSAGYLYTTGYHELGRAEKSAFTARFSYLFPGGITWTGYGSFNRNDQGYFVQWKSQNDPYEVDEAGRNSYAVTNQLNLYTKVDIPVSAACALNVRASLVRTLMGSEFGTPSDFNPALGQGAELQAHWIPGPGHRITGGVQFQQDAASTRYFGAHSGYSLGPYLQDEWTVTPALRLTAGFRYDRYQLREKPGEDLFSPRIGLNWQPLPGTYLRASAGSGFRAATMVERFLELSIMNFSIRKNEDLRAERSRAYDVGIRHLFSADCSVDISGFYTRYDDLIEAHMNLIRGFIQFRNVPDARVYGFEAALNVGGSLRLLGHSCSSGCQLSLTAMGHENMETGEPLPYRPNVLGTAGGFIKSGPLTGQVRYRYASRIAEVKVYPINERVPMHFLDLDVSLQLSRYRLQAGIRNLLQYNYAPMESNLMPMRTYTLGLYGSF